MATREPGLMPRAAGCAPRHAGSRQQAATGLPAKSCESSYQGQRITPEGAGQKGDKRESPSYSGVRSASGDQTHALFGQTMGYVAVTAGFFALGAYLGRHLSYGSAFVGLIAAFACLIGMRRFGSPGR